ncbi:10465_t:CDS:2, partial [Acaulospora colombiana]
RTLPETLKYRDPQPLVTGNGSSWDFHASEALKQELKDAIRDHFKFWKAGQRDKTRIPQYFILAGAGEGKSRTAQELPKLLIECTNDVDIQNRLRSALVFNLVFDNGTKLFETNSDYAIVDKNLNIATFEGKGITVDDVTQFGLVRFESLRTDQVVGYLTCPYIWLWIMADASRNDKLLRNWDFNYYNEVRNKAGSPSIPPGCQYWQNFEYFVAQFRSLKSNIYGDDVQVELRVIHNGAKHNFGDSSIYNRELTLEQSVKRVSTKSGNYKQDVKILCQDGEVDVTEARHIIINAPSAESGDSFCSIEMVGTGLLQTETHQCKLVKQIISQERFKDEHEKATSPGDTFILYTSTSSEKLEPHQPMSAIVSKENWEEYFGSFAGRCYNYAMELPNLNEATYTQLTGKNFIGET